MWRGTIRICVGPLLAGSLLLGCTAGDQTAPSAPSASAPASPTTPPPESPGTSSSPGDGPSSAAERPSGARVGSKKCALTRKRLGLVVRDWTRVYDSVGRGDHHLYTEALRSRVRDVRAASDGCRGADSLARFAAGVRRIDARAEDPQTDYTAYDVTEAHGDEWLRLVGMGPKNLSRG